MFTHLWTFPNPGQNLQQKMLNLSFSNFEVLKGKPTNPYEQCPK
jgi:hypothetical protein